MTILQRIVSATRADLIARPRDRQALEQAIAALGPSPLNAFEALSQPGRHIIAEIKRQSPSAGVIRADIEPVELAKTYEGGGATALSVLTEPRHFGGSLEDLSEVARAVAIPCLRKDFIVDEVQVLEARLGGAAMVLLIVAALDDSTLRSLITCCEHLQLLPLVETHSAAEIQRALDAGARFIGVNSRDLRDFSIDLSRAEALRQLIPEGVLAVAESGIETSDDVKRLGCAGYDIFLIGTRLMSASDPSAVLQSFLNAEAL